MVRNRPLDLTMANIDVIAERIREMEEQSNSHKKPQFSRPNNPFKAKLTPRKPLKGQRRPRPSPRTKRSESHPDRAASAKQRETWGTLWKEHGYPMPPASAAASRSGSVAAHHDATAYSSTGGGAHHTVSGARAVYAQRQRARFLNSIASAKTMRKLVEVTEFAPEEIEKLRQQFLDVAVSRELGPEMFQQFLLDKYPMLSGHNALVTQLFDHFDANNDGVVQFEEFILGLSKTVSATVEEKVDMLFACLDLSSDNSVSVSELMAFFNTETEDIMGQYKFAKDFLATLDSDRSGAVSGDEFFAALHGNQMLLQCFSKILPFPSMSEDPVRRLVSLSKIEKGSIVGVDGESDCFDFHGVKKLWSEVMAEKNGAKEGVADAINSTEVDRDSFVSMMSRYFGCTSDKQIELALQIFETFDEDKSGRISLGELLRGLSVLLAPTPEQLVEFYFKLFDSDGNGKIDEAELESMLEATSTSVESAHVSARNLLERGDIDSNGNISLDEFKKLAVTNPELLTLVEVCMRSS